MRPGPILADPPLTGHVRRSPHRASRVATTPLRTHPAATTPVESLGASFAHFPNDHSLPRFVAGSASTSALSRPARRSLTAAVCVLARSPTWPSTSKASAASFPPRPLRLLPAGAKIAGWDCPPTGESRLSTAHHKNRHT